MTSPETTVPGPARSGGAGHRRGHFRRRARTSAVAWGFALPFVVLFTAFGVGPILAAFFMSLSDMRSRDLRTPFDVDFVGLDNYLALLSDAAFVRAIGNTLYFVGVGIPLTMALALAVAFALNTGIGRLRSVFRVGYFAPVVTSIVAVAVVWRYLLNGDGTINRLLSFVGIEGPNWLNDPTWAMPALIAMAVWRNLGIPMVIFLAGLQAIPRDVYEAASVDGASGWRAFRSITLPLLRPTTLLVAVLLSVGYLQFFEESFVMTRGGPLGSTTSIVYYAYDQFGFGNYGVASAASYVLVILVIAASLIQFRLFRSKE